MNILITAGHTIEQIDCVRHIANFSTGKLAASIAEECLNFAQLHYICNRGAVEPYGGNISYITSVESCIKAILEVLQSRQIDAIVHSMAVSDYTVASAADMAKVEKELEQHSLRHAICSASFDKDAKISSRAEELLLHLVSAPKIIGMLREYAPNAKIFGFKLLADRPHNELIDTAYSLLKENSCDFVLANDTRDIEGQHHMGYLVDKSKNYQTFSTKDEIAKGIVAQIVL